MRSLGGNDASQIEDLSGRSNQIKDQQSEKVMNRDLSIATVALGTAMAGYFLSPLLALISLASNVYLTMPMVSVARKSWTEQRKVNIDTLSVLTMAIGLSLHYYAWCSIGNILYLCSKKLLLRIKNRSHSSVVDVFGHRPESVWKVVDGVELEVPLDQISPGDLVVIGAGEIVPVDGEVVKGMACIDQHRLTGESQPAEKTISDEVLAATEIITGKIYIRAVKTGKATAVEQISALLNRSAQTKTELQLHAEQLTDRSVIPTLGLSLLSVPFVGPSGAAAVLSSHFGYRMLVIAPIAILSAIRRLAGKGVLVKDGRILEAVTSVDTLVLDKTGTLTENAPAVDRVTCFSSHSEEDLLRFAAAAEQGQTHPIAKAIVSEAKRRTIAVPNISLGDCHIGYGITADVESAHVQVGSLAFFESEGIAVSDTERLALESVQAQGCSVVLIGIDHKLAGVIQLKSQIRQGVEEAIATLKKRFGESIYIISGDTEQPTSKLAKRLGITNYHANTLPGDKARIVASLQKDGRRVCFVGDGINDAVALREAAVSVSLSGASTAARNLSSVILMHEDLRQLCLLLDAADRLNRTLKASFAPVIAASAAGCFGAFFLNFTIVQAIILKQAGLLAGLGRAMVSAEKRHLSRRREANRVTAESRLSKRSLGAAASS